MLQEMPPATTKGVNTVKVPSIRGWIIILFHLFTMSSNMQGGVYYLFLLHMQNPGLPIQKLQDIQRAMELLSCQGPAKSIDEATKHKYQFWDTQPVPKLSKCQSC